MFYNEKAFRQINRVIGCSLVAHPLSYTTVQLKYNIRSYTVIRLGCFVFWVWFVFVLFFFFLPHMHKVIFAKLKVADTETTRIAKPNTDQSPWIKLRSDTTVIHLSYKRLPIYYPSNYIYKLIQSLGLHWQTNTGQVGIPLAKTSSEFLSEQFPMFHRRSETVLRLSMLIAAKE